MTAIANPQTSLFSLTVPLPPKEDMGLDAKAMLCRVFISNWDGYAYDQQVSDEIADMHGAEKDAGRYRKRLLPRKAFAEVTKIVGLARRRHKFYTLPWDDDNYRILPSAAYLDHREEMRELRTSFGAAVKRLEARYEELVRHHHGLGTMRKVADYPGMREEAGVIRFSFPQEFRRLYCFEEPKIKPMPTDDFRASVGEDERQRIQRQLTESLLASLRSGTRELWQRLYEPVAHMAKCMASFEAADKDSKPKLYDAMTENIVKVLDVLPKLNLEGNHELERMAEEIRSELIVERKEIRKSAALSSHLANKTAEITRRMAAYMGLPAEQRAQS